MERLGELVVLGAGSALPRTGPGDARYGPSGYALLPGGGAPTTLLDCGPGSIRALGAAAIPLASVRRVVLSHFHLDHCLDLFALAFARRNPSFDAPPVELIGPPGLRALVERAGPAFRGLDVEAFGTVTELALDPDGRCGFERDDLLGRAVANGHTAGAVSWRLEPRGLAPLAYSGDSGPHPALAEVARGVDLFVCECSHPDGRGVPKHLTPSGAADAAAEAGCRRLLLTHFYPELDPAEAGAVARERFGGEVLLARDGLRVALAPAP